MKFSTLKSNYSGKCDDRKGQIHDAHRNPTYHTRRIQLRRYKFRVKMQTIIERRHLLRLIIEDDYEYSSYCSIKPRKQTL